MHILDLFFPKRCVGCGRVGRYFCRDCASTVRLIEPTDAICPVCEKSAIDGFTHPKCKTRYGLDGLASFFHYDGTVRKAVKAIKYRFVSDLADEFVSLIPGSSLRIPDKVGNDKAIVIPIPLHPSRLRERGFNQAEVLGDRVASALRDPMRTDILKRIRKTTPQVAMKYRKERLQNMDHVFSLNTMAMKPWNDVILFDDVFTTGATMRSAANVLKRGGVRHVWAVTMAR